MKKIALSLFAVIISVSLFAGNDIKVSFCSGGSKITLKELSICKVLTVSSDDWKIKTATIGFAIGDDFKSIKVVGDKISDKLYHNLKSSSSDKIYIEQIVLVNSKGEEMKLGAQTITIIK